MEYGQLNKMKSILAESAKQGTQLCFITGENERIKNVFYCIANFDCSDETFICLLDLIKSDPVKLKKIFLKINNSGDTTFNMAMEDGQVDKIKSVTEESLKLEIRQIT